jgi:3',5'-cyclic AMP phosphodiesterase CpdA
MKRRLFLQTGIACSTGLAFARLRADENDGDSPAPLVSFGLFTDCHHAEKTTGGSRHYALTLEKMERMQAVFQDADLDFVIQLGDCIDASGSPDEDRQFLRMFDKTYAAFDGPRYYVLGNHCLDHLTKDEFFAATSATIKESYYTFVHGGVRFLVLDADFRADGEPYAVGNYSWTDSFIPESELDWIRETLATNESGTPVVAFLHQNLQDPKNAHGVKNGDAVRTVLESSSDVKAVFQGHMHTGGFSEINGIAYCTQKALVEQASLEDFPFAIVSMFEGGRIELEGFGREISREL